MSKFQDLQERLPADLLLRGVASLCASPGLPNPIEDLSLSNVDFVFFVESYITVRSRFSSSLAVLTICGYVLGIGDRHLENFLVHEKTGIIVGIGIISFFDRVRASS
jgi:hypothetical protein